MRFLARAASLALLPVTAGCLDQGQLADRKVDTSLTRSGAFQIERIDETRAQQILSASRELAGREGQTAELVGALTLLTRNTLDLTGGDQPPVTGHGVEPEPIYTAVGPGPQIPGLDLEATGENLQDYEFGVTQTQFSWFPYMSETEIQAVIAQGYRVHDVEVRNHAPLRFSAIFVKNEGPYARESLWKYDTTSAILSDLVDNHDYRVTALKPRQAGPSRRFSAILEKNTGSNKKEWSWTWDGSWSWTIDLFESQGLRPVDMEAYTVDGETLYAGVAIKNSGKDYRPWSTVEGITAQSVDSLAKSIGHRRYTDLDLVGSHFYGIFTGSPLVGVVEEGLNHWTHIYVPQSKIPHLIKRHGARVINAQWHAVVNAGENDGPAENGFFVTLVDNGTPSTGIAKEGFSQIDNAMIKAMKKSAIPGGGLAIAKNGKLVYARGYGYANIETNTLSSPETVFRMGSISKTMTGLSAMKLVDQGVPTLHGNPLTLDTRVFTEVIFPYFEGEPYSPSNISLDISYPHLAPITLRHLLTHTAGWYEQGNDYGLGLSGFPGAMPLNNTVQIAKDLGITHTPDCKEIVPYYFERPLDAAPGQYMFYSGLGICAAALVVEILANQHYGQHFISALVNPLSLNAGKTRFTYSTDYYAQRKPTEARFYDTFGNPKVSPLLIEMADHFENDGTPVFTQLVDPPYGSMPMRSIWSAGSWAASPVAMMRLGTALERTRRPYSSISFNTYKTAFIENEASIQGSYGTTGFDTNGSVIWHAGGLTGGGAYFQIYDEDSGSKSNLMFVLFFNATPDESFWTHVSSLKSAIYSSVGAINSATWDLFPQYGFVEPDGELNVPLGGVGDGYAIPTSAPMESDPIAPILDSGDNLAVPSTRR